MSASLPWFQEVGGIGEAGQKRNGPGTMIRRYLLKKPLGRERLSDEKAMANLSGWRVSSVDPEGSKEPAGKQNTLESTGTVNASGSNGLLALSVTHRIR